MAMSNQETLGGSTKKKVAMANNQPGTTSHPEETLGGRSKKKAPMAHMGPVSTSHPKETLGGIPKKKPTMVGNSGNTSAGDAASDI